MNKNNLYTVNPLYNEVQTSESPDSLQGSGTTIIYQGSGEGITAALKQKLDGILAGAEVNQFAFSNIKVIPAVTPPTEGSIVLKAKTKTDTFSITGTTPIELLLDTDGVIRVTLNDDSLKGIILEIAEDAIEKLSYWKKDGKGNIYTELNAYSTKEISAYGLGPGGGGGGGGGASALYECADVLRDGDKVLGALSGSLLSYNGTHWRAISQSSITPDLTGYATTVLVNNSINTAINKLVDSAPGTLDTLNEIAAALGDDPNFAATITGLLNALTIRVTDVEDKVLTFADMFVWDKSASATDKTKWRIKATKDFWGVGEISAYGYLIGTAPVGALYMHELKDTLFTNLASGLLLKYNGSKWVNINVNEVGLNETLLGIYLANNNYAKTSDIPSLTGYATLDWVTSKKYALQSTTITAGTGLTGGGDLTANRTLALQALNKNGIYTRVTTDIYGRVIFGDNANISDIVGLLNALDSKLNKVDFDKWFTIEYNTDGSIKCIKALHDFYSIGEITAYGYNTGEAPSGAAYLHELKDVSITTLVTGLLLKYNGTKWVNINANEVGLNETQLAQYLTSNNYAKKSDIPSLTNYATHSWIEDKGYLVATTTDKSNWDTTYTWGNHALAGYIPNTRTISAGVGLSGGGVLSANIELALAIAGTAGTYIKVTTDKYGRVLSGAALIALDIPNLPISKIISLQSELDKKLDITEISKWFTILYNSDKTIKSIRANYDFFSTGEVSAYGEGIGTSPVGALYLNELKDVTIASLTSGQLLKYNGTAWVNVDANEVGLNEEQLHEYLTTNNYALKSDIPSVANFVTSVQLTAKGYATEVWVTNKGYLVATPVDRDNWNKAILDLSSHTSNNVKHITAVERTNWGTSFTWGDHTLAGYASNAIRIIAGTGLSGGGNLTTNRTLSLATIGTAGVYTKVTTDEFGRITAGTNLSIVDIPSLPISKITNLLIELDKKLDITEIAKWFTILYNTDNSIKSIRANYDFFSTGEVSAYGAGTGSAPSGAQYLHELRDVTITTVSSGQLLLYNGSKWVNIDSNKVGIDEAQLNAYLTSNNYAKKSDMPSLTGYATEAWVTGKDYLVATATDKTNWNTAYGWGNHASKGYVLDTVTITAGTGLAGGGNLTTNRTISLAVVVGLTAGVGTKFNYDIYGRITSEAVLVEADIPTLSIAKISGLLTNLDTRALKTIVISAGTGLVGGGDISANRSFALATVGTAGTYPKVTVDAYGRVTAGTTLIATDIPALDWSKITTGKPTTASGYGITDVYPNVHYVYESAVGILVTTSAVAASDAMCTITITGNSYGSGRNIHSIVELYNYNTGDMIINSSCIHLGENLGNIQAFNYNGNVCIWFVNDRAYKSYIVTCYIANTNKGDNRMTSITGVAKPTTGVTREVTITPKINAFTIDNVASATVLLNQRTIWGQLFNGSSNVSGALSNVTSVTAAAGAVLNLIGNTAGIYLRYNNNDATSLVLSADGLKPFDTATGNLSLGVHLARWKEIFGVYGNFSGGVLASSFTAGTSSYNGDGIELSAHTPYIDFHFGNSTADYTSRLVANNASNLYCTSDFTAGLLISYTHVLANNGYLQSTANGFTVQIGSFNSSYCHYQTGAPTHYFNKQIAVNGDILPYDLTANIGTVTSKWNAAYIKTGIQIGEIWLQYDAANNAIKIVKADNTAANFYATGEVSAYGVGPGTTPDSANYLHELKDVELVTPTNMLTLVYNAATLKWINGAGISVITVKLGSVAYAGVNGIVTLPVYPTTLPASDVYAWAKAATKPSYSYGEISGTPPATDLSNYVTLNTAQTITGAKNFCKTFNAISPVEQPICINGINNTSSNGYLPAIGFHIPGITYASLAMNRDGRFEFLNNTMTGHTSVIANSFIKANGTASQLLRADGGVANFNWSGQSGQPTWLWGGNNQYDYNLYNPSNFRVANANTVGDVGIDNLVWGYASRDHGAQGTAYTGESYYTSFVSPTQAAFMERGSWSYVNNGHVTTDWGNLSLAGTAISTWGSGNNFTSLYISPLDSNITGLPGEMLFYSHNGVGYNKGWRRVLTSANWTSVVDGRYLPLTGGTITGVLNINQAGTYCCNFNGTNNVHSVNAYLLGGVYKANIGFMNNHGVYMYNNSANRMLRIDNNGNPYFSDAEHILNHIMWNAGNSNLTSVPWKVEELTFADTQFPKDAPPRANISAISLKVWDSYNQVVVGGDNYGVVLEVMGKGGHWDNQLYFQAYGHNIWHRASSYSDTTWTYNWARIAMAADLSSYLPLVGGTITGVVDFNSDLNIKSNGETLIRYFSSGIPKTATGWIGSQGSYIYNYSSGVYMGIRDSGTPFFNGQTMWHAGNDGAGSGLDADLLDGFHRDTLFTRNGYTTSGTSGAAGWREKLPTTVGTYYGHESNVGDIALFNSEGAFGQLLIDQLGLWYRQKSYESASIDSSLFIKLATLSDNVASATKLQTARSINGTAFDGSTNIETNYWGATRTFNFGTDCSGSAVINGSADVTLPITVNVATKLRSSRSNYKGITDDNVVGELMWKQYGNNHTIFDASNSTTPSGTVCNNSNPQVLWSNTYPTLMGWNGNNTYGVRVDYSGRTDRLNTPRSIWGQSFDGTGNILGSAYIDNRYGAGAAGIYSLCIGDTDTGLNWRSDGIIDMYANGTRIGYWNSTELYSYVGLYGAAVTAHNGLLYSIANGITNSFGSQNGDFCHYSTSAPTHYFNKQIAVNGDLLPYAGAHNIGNDGAKWGNVFAQGIVIGNSFGLLNSPGGHNTNGLASGNGDAASYTTHNVILRSWYGIGIRGNDDICRLVIDARSGTISSQGSINSISRSTMGGLSIGYGNSNFVLSTNSFICNDWVRTIGDTGWYSETYSGGIYMTDSSAVRVFNNKVFYNDGVRTWGIGGHHCGIKLYNASHTGINLANSAFTWGMYSNSDGNMYIGRRTGNVDDASGSYTIILGSGNLGMNGSITATGNIVAQGEVTAYSASDSRLKTNITSLTALDVLRKVSIYKFDWTDEALQYKINKNKQGYGVIALELLQILPDLITENMFNKGYLGVDYTKFIPMTISAIKEVDTEILQLKNKVAELEHRLNLYESINK